MVNKVNVVKSIEDLRIKVNNPNTTPKGVETAVRELKRVRPRTISYQQDKYGAVRQGWTDSIYDLVEISRAADTESLLSVSFRHHRELLLKEGFTIKGNDPKTVKIIKKRIAEIEAVSNRTFKSIIRQIATDLIKFHTAFLYKRRDANRSSGGFIRMFGKKLEPIAALEPIDPTSMYVKQNKSGSIIEWKQYIAEQGKSVKFEPDEVICITMDKKTGFVFGTPFCLPVLDDILTLRRLEELVDVISTKFAFPLVQYKVGTEKSPAQEYTDESGGYYSEVDMVKDTLGDLPTEGSIVTPERHEIIVLGSEGQVMNLRPYLDHFKERVMSGLRLSGVEVGQGDTANRGTAVTITKNMADAVKDYQEVLSDDISFYLFREILFEEGFDVTPENMVWIQFAPVDQEELRAKENHCMGLYQGNAITEDEMRGRMDMQPMTASSRSKTHLQLVEIPLVKAKAAIKAQQNVNASKALTKNKNMPANQHGTKPTKTKVTKNDAQILERWNYARNLVLDELPLRDAVKIATHDIVRFMSDKWRSQIKDGASKYAIDLDSEIIDIFFKKLVKKEMHKIEDKISMISRSLENEVPIVNTFDALSSVVLRTVNKLTVMAKAFGLLESAKKADITVQLDGIDYTDVKSLYLALLNKEDN